MQLKITADFAPITASLNRLQLRLGDLSVPMGKMGGILEASIGDRIGRTKQDPDGNAWANVNGKPRSHILIDSGNLLDGITHQASENSVIVGSDRLYAVYHQLGTRNMEARPFLGISADDIREIDELLAKYLNGAFEA